MSEFFINDALSFVSVVEEGSFAAAAKKLFISTSVVSKRISRLENHLRVQLMQRTTRTMALTESGQLFYERWKRIKAEMSDAEADVKQHHQHLRGVLRINAPMSFGQVHLVPAVNDFIQLYPEIQIELILGSQYAGFIYNGLDLTIFIKDLPDTPLLKSRKIAVRSTGIYGSPHYFDQYGRPQKPEDLTQHNCLIYQSEPGSFGQKYEWTFYIPQRISVPVNGNLRINSNQALVKAAVAGLGIVKLSSFMVADEIKNGTLEAILSNYCEKDIDIHVAYPNQRYLPYKVRLFIDFLIERFKSEAN
ncbi:MAG TPA: LysR family transcriptional regulator [Gammaproteobacteria bacterium]|nr:LysR family transcriptional regulator [Gammaproteobacteria bacterium]